MYTDFLMIDTINKRLDPFKLCTVPTFLTNLVVS